MPYIFCRKCGAEMPKPRLREVILKKVKCPSCEELQKHFNKDEFYLSEIDDLEKRIIQLENKLLDDEGPF